MRSSHIIISISELKAIDDEDFIRGSPSRDSAGSFRSNPAPQALWAEGAQSPFYACLDTTEHAILAAASKQFNDIEVYQQALAKEYLLLFHYTIKSCAEAAEVLARRNYSLILRKCSFKEELCSESEWDGISPLEYAALQGNTPVVDFFLRCLPKKEKPKALAQLKGVKENGLNGKPHLFYVFALLKIYKQPPEITWAWTSSPDRTNTPYLMRLGSAQRQAGFYFLKEFCKPRSFPALALTCPEDEVISVFTITAPQALDLSSSATLGIGMYLTHQPEDFSARERYHYRPEDIENNKSETEDFYNERKEDLSGQIQKLAGRPRWKYALAIVGTLIGCILSPIPVTLGIGLFFLIFSVLYLSYISLSDYLEKRCSNTPPQASQEEQEEQEELEKLKALHTKTFEQSNNPGLKTKEDKIETPPQKLDPKQRVQESPTSVIYFSIFPKQKGTPLSQDSLPVVDKAHQLPPPSPQAGGVRVDT